MHWNSYTLETPEPLPRAELEYIASHVLYADRWLTGWGVKYTKVLCFEVDPEKPFHQFTPVHIFLPAVIDEYPMFLETPGFRRIETHALGQSLQLSISRKRGIGERHEFRGAVSPGDLVWLSRDSKAKEHPHLRRDSKLYKFSIPIHNRMLEMLGGAGTGLTVDRSGALDFRETLTGKRFATSIPTNARRISALSRADKNRAWYERVLVECDEQVNYWLEEYDEMWSRFEGYWSDWDVPTGNNILNTPNMVASLWYPLARLLGYQINGEFLYPEYPFFSVENNPDYLTPAKWRGIETSAQAFQFVQTLYTCHQWLEKNVPKTFHEERHDRNIRLTVQYPNTADKVTQWQMYELWEPWSRVCFAVFDAFYLLMSVLQPPAKPGLEQGKNTGWFEIMGTPPTGFPHDVYVSQWVACNEYFPYKAGPFMSRPKPVQAKTSQPLMLTQPPKKSKYRWNNEIYEDLDPNDPAVILNQAIEDGKEDLRKAGRKLKRLFVPDPQSWEDVARQVRENKIRELHEEHE
jgi:hypothetical protein